jgi:hypothetical protein
MLDSIPRRARGAKPEGQANGRLGAAHVGEQGARCTGRGRGQHLLGNAIDRRAEDHQVGPGGGFLQAGTGLIDDAMRQGPLDAAAGLAHAEHAPGKAEWIVTLTDDAPGSIDCATFPGGSIVPRTRTGLCNRMVTRYTCIGSQRSLDRERVPLSREGLADEGGELG